MKKIILVLSFVAMLFVINSGLNFVNGYASEKQTVVQSVNDWEEYVYIGGFLYKIIHHEDGSIDIQAAQGTTGN